MIFVWYVRKVLAMGSMHHFQIDENFNRDNLNVKLPAIIYKVIWQLGTIEGKRQKFNNGVCNKIAEMMCGSRPRQFFLFFFFCYAINRLEWLLLASSLKFGKRLEHDLHNGRDFLRRRLFSSTKGFHRDTLCAIFSDDADDRPYCSSMHANHNA